jgi:hypothetical protein
VKSAEIQVYRMGDESLVGLKAFDAATHTLTFSTRAGR